jgi:uncharacterized protein (DUF1330 family)
MKIALASTLALIGGVCAGGAAVQSINAQTNAPVYLIAVNQLSDRDAYFKEYAAQARKTVIDHGGEYIAVGPSTQITGDLPNGTVVVIRWKSMDALQGWRSSPEYQEVLRSGEKYAKFNIIAVDGIAQ